MFQFESLLLRMQLIKFRLPSAISSMYLVVWYVTRVLLSLFSTFLAVHKQCKHP